MRENQSKLNQNKRDYKFGNFAGTTVFYRNQVIPNKIMQTLAEMFTVLKQKLKLSRVFSPEHVLFYWKKENAKF